MATSRPLLLGGAPVVVVSPVVVAILVRDQRAVEHRRHRPRVLNTIVCRPSKESNHLHGEALDGLLPRGGDGLAVGVFAFVQHLLLLDPSLHRILLCR